LSGAALVVNAAGLATPDASASAQLYGANALLPSLIAIASARAQVSRFIHLSSAAVQGRRAVLDESAEVSPFSPYSRSKALGEWALLALQAGAVPATDCVIIRATSVQGSGRATTNNLRRIASSPLSSVAAPGTQPTVVSSLDGLTSFIHKVGLDQREFSGLLLQPWEGLSVAEALRRVGNREPRRLPRWICSLLVSCGYAAGRLMPELAGVVRRVELMWFGQGQVASLQPEAMPDCNSFTS
jgi:hypothetical protein